MKDSITIRTDNPFSEEEVTLDELGYSAEDWDEMSYDDKLHAVVQWVGVDFFN